MRNLPNIEKSAFRPSEYVGYAGGFTYRIRKSLSNQHWEATARDMLNALDAGCHVYLTAPTLAALSAKLAN